MADQETKATNQFNQLPLQQKLLLAAVGAALLALFTGLWMWGQTPTTVFYTAICRIATAEPSSNPCSR